MHIHACQGHRTAISLSSCSVERMVVIKHKIPESRGLFVIVVYELNYAFVCGGCAGRGMVETCHFDILAA